MIYKDDLDEDSKFRPQSLWDGHEKKLVIYIMEGVGIVPPEGGIQIRLRYEPSKNQKLKHKTSSQYTEDPKWNELIYFDLSTAIDGCSADDLAKTSLMMEYVSVKRNAVLGEAPLCVPTGATLPHFVALSRSSKSRTSLSAVTGLGLQGRPILK